MLLAVRMNSPMEGSRVKPFTPLPVDRTIMQAVPNTQYPAATNLFPEIILCYLKYYTALYKYLLIRLPESTRGADFIFPKKFCKKNNSSNDRPNKNAIFV